MKSNCWICTLPMQVCECISNASETDLAILQYDAIALSDEDLFTRVQDAYEQMPESYEEFIKRRSKIWKILYET